MLSNTTIIIPAHNRPERLQRLLNFYADTDVHILIPDSSDALYRGSIPNPERTLYRHLPRMHFFDKLLRVIDEIRTPYVLYCADDDFAIPSGIDAVTDFLDNNPDFSIAQGHYLTFTPKADGSVEFLPRYIRNFDNRIDNATAIDRLNNRRQQYASLLYGVTRSDIFKKIYSFCFRRDGSRRFSNLFLAEEYFNFAMLAHGKYATMPVFFSARERIEGSATVTTVPVRTVKTSPKYADEFAGYIEALSLMFADATGENFTKAEAVMREASAAAPQPFMLCLKRTIVDFMARHRAFAPLTSLADRRYAVKGLRAVAGMPSYPCNDTDNPDRRRIIEHVTDHK